VTCTHSNLQQLMHETSKKLQEHRKILPITTSHTKQNSIVLSVSTSLVHISHGVALGMAAETSNACHTRHSTNLHKLINAHATCTETLKGHMTSTMRKETRV